MTLTTTSPGVNTLKTDKSVVSATRSSTAVPVFLCASGEAGKPEDLLMRFNSWADVKAVIPGDHSDQRYYAALRFWFSQGGGACYLLDSDYPELINTCDDITLIVATGHNKTVIPQLDALCGPGKCRFMLLDGPAEPLSASCNPEQVMHDYPESPYAAAWYPSVKVSWAKKPVPSSIVAAAAIAKRDRTRGVWVTPANIIMEDTTPLYAVSDALNGRFNKGKALNMIRTFPGTGTTLWGSRTLEDSDNWRYIGVRRLFSYVESHIQHMMNKIMFEANHQPTWHRVRYKTENYLHALWQQGALAGSCPEEAFFVRVGRDITQSPQDAVQRKRILKVGIAATRPAEFTLLNFSQSVL